MPRKRKHRNPEYSLHVFHYFDERIRKVLQVFLVQTVKEFTSFHYEILLDVALRERTIQVKILGLRTTPLTMPGVGPARGREDFSDLRGSYQLNIAKLDGELNEFQIDLSPSSIVISGSPASPFITVSNTPVMLQ
ncbi:MAG: hypothetical protein NTU47_09960 [Ignavibacteriales bacterium]|nr:hypothetical protein [Ignavibacteriales bacterium]